MLRNIVKFSIIIPVYNVAPYLRECLDSVLAQTFTDWEAICVDDGSTDESSAILDEFKKKDGRFRVVHKINSGVSAARNMGLELAEGEWVWFVDGDDAIAPCALSWIVSVLRNRTDIDAVRVPFIEGIEKPVEWSGRAELLDAGADIKLRNAFVGAPAFGIFRRSQIGNMRFEAYKWLEDILFTVRYLKSCGDMLELKCPLYFYRQRAGSAIHSKRTREEVRSIFECQRIIFSEFEKWERALPLGKFAMCWKQFHVQAYFSFFGQYFKLSAADRKLLLPEWISMQKMFAVKYPVSMEWRIRIALVRLFNSGVLVKPLVLCGSSLRGRVSMALNHIKLCRQGNG